jgi:hypothetical protein
VNKDMHQWANFLKNKTIELGGTVIDTSKIIEQDIFSEIIRAIQLRLNKDV